MNSRLCIEADSNKSSGWTRVSSFKPHVLGVVLTAIVFACLMFAFRGRNDAPPLIAAVTAIALGLIALNWKVVHRRGEEYRVATLFYAEIVKVDDVCMSVTKPGPFWTRVRIHLRRPARFGWMVSFVPANESLDKGAQAK